MFESIRFSLLQFLFWSAIVCFEAFMVPYLRELGYSPSQIGPIMSAVFGLAIIGQPLLGSISDRIRSPRYLVAGAMAVAGVTVSFVPHAAASYLAIIAIALVYSVTANSLPAVLDAWLMERGSVNPRVVYGFSRGFGSLGFAAGGVLLGVLSERHGPEIIFPVFLGIMVLVSMIVIGMPQRERRDTNAPSENSLRSGFRAVLSNRKYLTLLLAALFAFTGLRAGLTFLPLLVESLNGSLTIVGAAHSIGAISEVPFFFLVGWILRRIDGRRLIIAALSVLGVRLFSYTFLQTPGQILIVQVSHGMTFGVFLAASVDYIHHIAPPQHRGLFQTLAPSVYFGVGSIVGSWVGGWIVEAYSILTLYRVAGTLAFIAIPVFVLFSREKNPGIT